MIEFWIMMLVWFIPIVLIAVWIDYDAKERGMSQWYAVLLVPVFQIILFLPLLVFGVEFGLILDMILYALVVLGWLALRSKKHPLITPPYPRQMQPTQQPIQPIEIQPTEAPLPIPQPAQYLMLCPNCRKPVQPDWVSCPYCRTLLRAEEEDVEKKRRQTIVNAMEELLKKEANFFVEDVKNCLSKNDLEGAEKLLAEKNQLYDRFLELKKDMMDVDKKITKLSTKLAEGEVTSDAYERAMDSLEREKRDIEEKLWKIQNKIFREKYEKPF